MTNNKLKIAIDMDDVLCQFMKSLIKKVNKDFCSNISVDDIKGWDIHNYVPNEVGEFVYEYLSVPGFYKELEPVKGAVLGMQNLIEAGHDVVIATASPHDSDVAYIDKRDWVRENLPFFPIKNFQVGHRKDLLNCNILFDDGAHNIESFKYGIGCLMKRPWNESWRKNGMSLTTKCAFTCVDNWDQFMSLVDSMSPSSKSYFYMASS